MIHRVYSISLDPQVEGSNIQFACSLAVCIVFEPCEVVGRRYIPYEVFMYLFQVVPRIGA